MSTIISSNRSCKNILIVAETLSLLGYPDDSVNDIINKIFYAQDLSKSENLSNGDER